jgi:SAM-dependent methyltransferase
VSREQLNRHRRLWTEKPVLAEVYSVWFNMLLEVAPETGRVVEVGSGPGLLSAEARRRRPGVRWIATDLLEVPWNDVVADGHVLPFRDGSADAIVGLDVVHHLASPAAFFRETARVLRPGGRLAVVEPWISPFSFAIYRLFHQERCSLRLRDPWQPFADAGAAAKDAFEGDAAVLPALVRSTSPERWRELGLAPPEIRLLNAFAYILSLGFRDASLLPRRLAGTFIGLDERTSALGSLLALRALAVWRRPQG